MNKTKEKHSLSLKLKLVLSLSAIAMTLLASGSISVLEYSRMKTYVSGLIAENIKSINAAQSLSDASGDYNLEILAVIGDDTRSELPDFDRKRFMGHCDSLRTALSQMSLTPLADSVVYSYSAYMAISMELPDVLSDPAQDSRAWYFERLQPGFNRLSHDIEVMSSAIYDDLVKNSETFDRGLFRSIVPGIVALGVGLLMIFMLMFFLMEFYADPICRMLISLRGYRSLGKRYTLTFDGDDQLSELNASITELVNENILLKKRILDRKIEAEKRSSDES